MNCKLIIPVRNKLLYDAIIVIESALLFHLGVKAMYKYAVYINVHKFYICITF